MRRFCVLLAGFSLLISACGDDSDAGSTTTVPTATSSSATAVTTTSPPTTTTTTATPDSTTTTVEDTTTTSEPTTTTTLAPVTVDPGLPAAQSRSSIPWDQVDQGWVVVRYDATTLDLSRHGPYVIYLVSPAGTLYEIRAFTDADPIIGEVEAFSNSGRHVVLEMIARDDHERFVASISLETGSYRTVLPLPAAYSDLGTTLPTGRDVVVNRMDSATSTDYLEVYWTNGDLFASIASKPSFGKSYTWLYGLDGLAIVVNDGGSGMEVYANDGTHLRSLDVPPGQCDPVRWWDSETILARCVPDYVLDGLGHYHVLWLVPFDGTEPTRITQMPLPTVDVVEFGHADAWRAEGRTLLQWYGDCAARGIQVLESDMSTELFLVAGVSGGHWIHAQDGSNLVIHSILGCGDHYGPVSLISANGPFLRTLVPQIAGYHGVTSVAAMIPTP